jgi:hypothetical protein
MVVGVEESQWLLLENEEDGVDQLEVLGKVVHLQRSAMARNEEETAHIIENNQLVGPATIVAADSMEDTVPDHFWEQLLNEECKEATGDDGKVEVVDHEGTIEDECRPLLHQFSSTKYYNIVCS